MAVAGCSKPAPTDCESPLREDTAAICIVDAPLDAPFKPICDPTSEGDQVCITGRKCAWGLEENVFPDHYELVCTRLVGGEVGLGESCTPPTRDGAGGFAFDNCGAGLYCDATICKQVCKPAINDCVSGTCTTHPDVFFKQFQDGTTLVFAGLCE